MSMRQLLGRGFGRAVGLASGGASGVITGLAGSMIARLVPGQQGGGSPPSPGGGYNMPFPVKGPGGVPLPGFNPGGVQTQCPKGYHLNKHALAASKKHKAVPAHSLCVRNRTINPLNHRALTRSLKRLKRAGKLVRKLHGVGSNRGRAIVPSRGHKPGCGCFACRRK